MSHTARESLPPDTATSTRSPGSIIEKSLIALATWSRQRRRKCSAQKLALWRRMSMTAGALQTRALHAAPPEMTGRISTTSLSSSEHVAGHERVAADDEHRLAVELEALEERVDADRSVDLELALGVAEEDLHLSLGADRCARSAATGPA